MTQQVWVTAGSTVFSPAESGHSHDLSSGEHDNHADIGYRVGEPTSDDFFCSLLVIVTNVTIDKILKHRGDLCSLLVYPHASRYYRSAACRLRHATRKFIPKPMHLNDAEAMT